ncbi:hypothetical protein FHT02_003093 [Sphingomonas xinjiangensis]|uniref:Uncharacterized protein n=1 Tax=Sphingomonas xinjiangensis TaxID=643568 RepID=A0A840YR27_9SPHN|nr:hypothetical protein [Sphingomonas xinjiangensis]
MDIQAVTDGFPRHQSRMTLRAVADGDPSQSVR